MNFGEYQQLALRTAKPLDRATALMHGAMGCADEAGEITKNIKAHTIYGKDLDKDELVKDLGDMLWFVAYLAAEIGVSLNVVARINIDKLRKRYPTGYNDQDAIARMDEIPPPPPAREVKGGTNP